MTKQPYKRQYRQLDDNTPKIKVKILNHSTGFSAAASSVEEMAASSLAQKARR